MRLHAGVRHGMIACRGSEQNGSRGGDGMRHARRFRILATAAALILTAAAPGPARAGGPEPAVSPGLAWLDQVRWVNHAPIRAEDLKGHVVVVEFWTFECINCMRTVPAM